MIPKVIHFIWFGQMNLQLNEVVESAKRMNPDFRINLVNELDIDNPSHPDVIECLELCKTHPFFSRFSNSSYYDGHERVGIKLDPARRRMTELSDVLRLHLLNKYGGIYLDMDVEFIRPFDDRILCLDKFFMAVESGTNGVYAEGGRGLFVDCFFIGSQKGLVDGLMDRPGFVPSASMNWNTVAEGKAIEYSVQPYIRHLWTKTYLRKRPSESKDDNKDYKAMKLQILVPQYREKKEVLKPLLDSIALQQGINLDEVGVIIVNDGYPKSKLPAKFISSYPFKVEYYMEEHRGVSGTRNACLDHATAEYVMWCDADDMFFSMVGLNIMMAEMDKETVNPDGSKFKGFNALITEFYEEIDRNGARYFVPHKNDRTFVHGKFYNRQYLIDNHIRFNDKLTVHEDSYFNVLATTLSKVQNAIKYSPVPVYMWKWRKESVARHDPLYMQKTYRNYLDSMTALITQLLGRGMPQLANQFVCQMMFDTYYLMNTPDWLKQENQEYRIATEKRFLEFYNKFEGIFNSLDNGFKMNISNQVRAGKINQGMQLEAQTFTQWIEYIKGLDDSIKGLDDTASMGT